MMPAPRSQKVPPPMRKFTNAYDVRLACRKNELDFFPSLALPGYLCVNLVMMDRQYADEFEAFCRKNPSPCPLLGVIPPGETAAPTFGTDIDLRSDLGSYDVIADGDIADRRTDVIDLYHDQMVSFLIGSSVSFDGLLVAKGYAASYGPCIYITALDCTPVGRFRGKIAVTMRSYSPAIADQVAEYTSHFPRCHGGPIGRNNAVDLGIVSEREPYLPFPGWVPQGHDKLYWSCGITPSIVAREARLPMMIVHTPGYAMVTDIPTEDLYDQVASSVPAYRRQSSFHG